MVVLASRLQNLGKPYLLTHALAWNTSVPFGRKTYLPSTTASIWASISTSIHSGKPPESQVHGCTHKISNAYPLSTCPFNPHDEMTCSNPSLITEDVPSMLLPCPPENIQRLILASLRKYLLNKDCQNKKKKKEKKK